MADHSPTAHKHLHTYPIPCPRCFITENPNNGSTFNIVCWLNNSILICYIKKNRMLMEGNVYIFLILVNRYKIYWRRDFFNSTYIPIFSNVNFI